MLRIICVLSLIWTDRSRKLSHASGPSRLTTTGFPLTKCSSSQQRRCAALKMPRRCSRTYELCHQTWRTYLTPEVETLFGAMGVRSGFVAVKGLVLDLGGGSVQMTYLDTQTDKQWAPVENRNHEIAAALAGRSLPFGAARMIKVLEEADADERATAKSQLAAGLSEAFQDLRTKSPSLAAAADKAQESERSEAGPRPSASISTSLEAAFEGTAAC
ncbi:hypothetical protein VTK26DRAFT_8531 [Humicola hyalothermophila]